MHAPAALGTIPVLDIRDGGPARYAIEGRDRVLALRDDCVGFLPRSAQSLLPTIDGVTRRWLRRSCSPYVPEIEAIAQAFGFPGIWFLNGCYQWGCTAFAREQDGAPWLVRTLDWPFHGLGRHLEITRMRGPAGDFYNVTWPGYVGMLTGSAPGRFAASINQAPLRRRTRRPWLRLFDIAANALNTWQLRFVPPDHLLRDVFETCKNFAEARERLERTPVARPVIYTLAGCESGERCVIERTEEGFETRTDDTAAANDWRRAQQPWEARVSSDMLFRRTYDQAAERSAARKHQLASYAGEFARGSFEWVAPPVLNGNTRLAVEMCPAKGVLRAIGYELLPGSELPQPVTSVCEVTAAV